jgi:hypothetical protein
MVATSVLLPTNDAFGAKTAWLFPPEFVTVKNAPFTAVPLLAHEYVNGKLFGSLPFAANVKVEPTLSEFPVAAGVCEEQVGGEFFTTVHDLESELVPFVTVAVSVLLPVDKLDERTE